MNPTALLECLYLETLVFVFRCGIRLLLLVVAATYMAWSNEDRRAEEEDCLQLRSW